MAHTGLMTSAVLTRGPRAVAVGAVAVAFGAVTAALVMVAAAASAALGWSWADALDAFVVTNAAMALTFGLCGTVLAWHRPGNPIGWLFGSGGLMQAVAASAAPVGSLAVRDGWPTPVIRGLATAFLYSWPWAIGLCIPLAMLLFPDGRLPSRRWRPVLAVVLVAGPLFVVQMGSAPLPVDTETGTVGYLTLPFYDRLGPLWTAVGISLIGAYVLALLALAGRYRRGDDVVRRQLLWLLLALLAAIVANLLWSYVQGTSSLVLLTIPLIPIAVTVAVVRHQLLDIRLVLSRTASWVLLTLMVVVAYAALVAVLDRVISSQVGRSAVATVVLALAAAPVLPRLQRLVDRAVWGDRRNPARLVGRVGEQLSATAEAGLDGAVAAVRDALRLPYLGLDHLGHRLAEDGTPATAIEQLPLRYAGTVIGHLHVGLRPGEQRLAEADRRVLDLLALPLGAAAHATAVSAELQASRERLVGAREEERRRLRRELHDGLGPALTGIALTADAAANLQADPTRLPALLERLRGDSRAALADVRRVVEDLRPASLDELGLVGALEQRAEQLARRTDGTPLRVDVDLPTPVPPLPAAVEVAGYRIATEALTNAVRHADRASRVRVRLRCADRFELEVSDDGRPNGRWVPGVGLTSMRERVAELGGSFEAGPSGDGGRVRVSFPLKAAP